MYIEIEIPSEIGLNANDLAKWIELNSALEAALDLTPNPGDSMLQYIGHTIAHVEIVGSRVEVGYRVDCCAHHACKDISYEQSFFRKAFGTIQGSVVRFEKYCAPEPPSTHDEF